MTTRWILLLLLCAVTAHADRLPSNSPLLKKVEAAQAATAARTAAATQTAAAAKASAAQAVAAAQAAAAARTAAATQAAAAAQATAAAQVAAAKTAAAARIAAAAQVAVEQLVRQQGRAVLRAPTSSQVSVVTVNPAPASTQTNRLQIHGSAEFQKRINSALDLLKEKDPEGHSIVLSNLNLITESPRWTCVDVQLKVTYFNMSDTELFWCASVLIHEAMHVVYSYDHFPSWGTAAELFSIRRQHEGLIKIDAPAYMILHVAGQDGTHWMKVGR